MPHTYCSQKPPASLHSAAASAKVLLGPRVFELVEANRVKEGDMLSVSQLGGRQGGQAHEQPHPTVPRPPHHQGACVHAKALLQTSLLLLLLLWNAQNPKSKNPKALTLASVAMRMRGSGGLLC